MPRIARVPAGFLVLAAAVVLTGCKGQPKDNASQSGNAAKSGTVAVLLTDAPTDRFERIYLTVKGIDLIPKDGKGEPVPLYSGDTRVDLMRLAAVSDLFAVRAGVPAADYPTIRLKIPRARLIDDDPRHNGKPGEIVATVPGGKVDLHPRQALRVRAGASLVIEIDVDAERSALFDDNPQKAVLRPAVFARALDGLDSNRLVRIHGRATRIDSQRGRFAVCPAGASLPDKDKQPTNGNKVGCMTVAAGDDTGIFSAEREPEAFSALSEGEELSVIGFIQLKGPSMPSVPLLARGYVMEAVVLRLGPQPVGEVAKPAATPAPPGAGSRNHSIVPPVATASLSGKGDSLSINGEEATLH